MQLSIVVPCYNEEAVLPETGRWLIQELEALQSAGTIANDSKINSVHLLSLRLSLYRKL